MPIVILCPHLSCRSVLRVPDNVRGKRVRCSQCGMTFLVPDKTAAAPAAPKPKQDVVEE
jgi:predicted Zn finger-like uncharacterized protein